MWLAFALGSALFAGLTSILAKLGIKKTDSNVATAIRTVVVLAFSWLMVFIVGSHPTIVSLDLKTWLFLVLSGMATGSSWLFYFKALQVGNINKVVLVDKSSTILTILLALIFLNEKITVLKTIAVLAIGLGTYLMIQKKEVEPDKAADDKKWLLYAALAAVFASLTAILGKVGISGVESNLGTAIRNMVVLVMAWVVVFVTGKRGEVAKIPKNEFGFVLLSGLATGTSWLCYYRALKDGSASVVVPVDKLSILVTILFSFLVFGEKLTKKAVLGLGLVVAGTMLMIVS